MSERKSHTKGWIFLTVFALILGAVVYGIHRFVSIDDLAGCKKAPASGKCSPADAIVVVSGGDTRSRTDEAVKLYKNGWAQVLIVSGAAKDTDGPSNAEVMRRHAVEAGVPPSSILVDTQARNTNQNAAGATQLARPRGIDNIIVVTSPYHMARTNLLFKREFADFGTVRSHSSGYGKDWSERWYLTGSGWQLLTSEMVKYLLELTRGSVQERQ